MTDLTIATILNTRPIDLQKHTHNAFVKNGFNVLDFPCIKIHAIAEPKETIIQLYNITADDILIFTSQYAVRFAYKIYPNLTINRNNTVIVVGKKTAHVLEQNHSGHIWIPEQQNSIGVIDLLKGLSNCGSIKLISAANGIDLIEKYASGADINFTQINVYQRQLPTANKKTINIISKTNQLFILATSTSTLNNLKIILKDKWEKVLNHTVVCASSRIQKAATQLGFKNTLNFHTADSKLMAEQLRRFVTLKYN